MAKLNRNSGACAPLNRMKDAATAILNENATSITEQHVGNVIGLENYNTEGAFQARNVLDNNLQATIKQRLESEGIVGVESLTSAQLEAGAIILMASANPTEYAKRAMNTDFIALESGAVDAPMVTDGMDVGAQAIALEYFNDTSLDTHMAASFTFNLQAAKQGPFAEAFFPTIVADPSECGLLVEINKTMVYRAVRHAIHDKDNAPFNRRNVLDAATDPTVLDDQSINFVPYRLEDDANAELFVPKDKMAPKSIEVGDYFVPTSPLAFETGVKNLLRLSAHPGLVSSGVLDESDEFDGRVALDKLYFTFNTKAGADADAQVVQVNTLNLTHASFNKSQEGDGRDMTLNFRNAKFAGGAETTDIAGAPVAALADLVAGKYRLQYTITLTSNFNLQTGDEEMTSGNVRVVAVFDEDGNKLDMKKGEVKTLLDNIVIKPFGYVYKATRSNSNRRVKGLLLDNVSSQERYKITLGSPITSRKPIGTVDDSKRLNDLITAARMRNDNLAITKLLSYTETLKEVCEARVDEYEIPSIEGTGRHYVAPHYSEFDFDAVKMVSTVESADVATNLANALLGVLRTQVVTAYRDSRFQPALEMISGYTISKPSVIIGTDPYTANWLWIQGDLRTLGDQFNYRIVTTNDVRFRDRIQWAFEVQTSENGFCPLNFGNHLWVPELITNTNLSRSDATTNELTVQPRNYHIVNCPITGIINCTGLDHYVTSKPELSINAKTTDVTPKDPAPAEVKAVNQPKAKA